MNMHSISNFLKTVSTALLNLLLVEYISIVEAGMEAEGQVLRAEDVVMKVSEVWT